MFCKSRTWVVLAAAWSWAGKAELSLFQCPVPKQTSADLNPFRPITPRAGWSIPYESQAGTWLLWVWTEGKLMGEALVSREISLAVSTEMFYSSVQFSRSVVSDSLRPHELQPARPPCPSPTPRVHSTYVYWVGDAIQPSHPLSSPSPPASNPSQHQGLFQWINSSHEVEFQL